MNFLTLVLNINLCIYLSYAEIKEEDGIMVLTEKNFDEVVTKDVDILVEFFSLDCGFCQLLAPEYIKLAKLLQDENYPVKIAKVDTEKAPKLEQRFNITGVPAIKLFRKGKSIDYDGGANVADHILTWIHKKIGEATKLLNTVEDYDNFLKVKKVAVVGFFRQKDSKKVKAFKKAAEKSYIEFGITHSKSVAMKADVMPSQFAIVLYKKYDEEVVRYEGKYKAKNIIKFLNKESIPLILDIADQTTDMFVEEFGVTKQVYLISSKKSPNHQEMYDNFKAVAPLYKGKALFLYGDFESEHSVDKMEMASLIEGDLPAVRVIEMSEDTAISYKPETKENLTSGEISEFVQSYLDGKLTPYFTWKEPTEEEDADELEEGGTETEGEQLQEGSGKHDAEGEGEGAQDAKGEKEGAQDAKERVEGTEEKDEDPGVGEPSSEKGSQSTKEEL